MRPATITATRPAWAFFRSLASGFLVALPGLIAAFLILRAFLDGNVSDIEYGLALALIFFGTLAIRPLRGQARRQARLRRWRMALLVVPIVVIFPLSVVVLIFGTVDMAAYVLHLYYGTGGTPWADLLPYVATALIYWLVLVACIYRSQPWLERIPFSTSLIAIGILALNPLVNDLALGRARNFMTPQESLVDRFAPPVLREEADTPNLLILYVEGMERTYGDPSFGNAYGALARLEAQAISFTNVGQMTATGWSLAGTIATQCGAPLLLKGARRIQDIETDAPIVPGATCLTDIAARQGYDIWYVSGTELLGESESYYGYGNFFKAHGGASFIDRSVIAAHRDQEVVFDETQGWGFRDELVLDVALAKYRELLAADRPFVLNVATMDTHGPVAFRSDSCLSDGDVPRGGTMLDAVECSAGLVARFIEAVRATDGERPTRIVVMSDHLAHHNDVADSLDQLERRNTVFFLRPDQTPVPIDKAGTMVDVYPTLLDWMGWLDRGQPGAGLGVSLLSDAPTLRQEFGLESLNERLKLDVDLGRHIWQLPG